MVGSIRRWALAPIAGEVYVRDVPVAPEAVAARIRSAINVPPKRLLGILKAGPELIGQVDGLEFAIWERRQHATRMTGRIKARRGGSRVEARLEVRRRTWLLSAIFFVLFAGASYGLLTRPDGIGTGPIGIAIAIVGALVMLGFFWSTSLRQMALLKAFLAEVLRAAEG